MSKASSFLDILEDHIKTHTGSRISRSKYGVGKDIGGVIYVHKNYASEVVPPEIWKSATSLVPKGFTYNTIVYSPKVHTIRFDEAPDFDKAREPIPGDIITINYETGFVDKMKHSDSIWHHKWLWVKDDYKGFDVDASREWSRKWTSKFKETAIGRLSHWKQQLSKYGIE